MNSDTPMQSEPERFRLNREPRQGHRARFYKIAFIPRNKMPFGTEPNHSMLPEILKLERRLFEMFRLFRTSFSRGIVQCKTPCERGRSTTINL